MESGHNIPVGGVTTSRSRVGSGAVGREQKDPIGENAEATIQQVRRAGEKLYDKACDACHNWRHYPKLLTTVVLLSSFLLGAGLTSSVSRMGIMGSGRNYVSGHWDRETADAHHALDVVLDHLKHPELYRGERAESYVHKARRSIGDFLSGILPGGRNRKGWTDEMYDQGRDMYDKATGRTIYDKATGRGVMDKLGDIKDEMMYRGRSGLESAKDTGYGLGSKLSDAAHSVKDTLGMGGRGYDEGYLSQRNVPSGGGSSWFGLGGGQREREHGERPSRGWFGLGGGEREGADYMRRGHDERDEFRLAQNKLNEVQRRAEREI